MQCKLQSSILWFIIAFYFYFYSSSLDSPGLTFQNEPRSSAMASASAIATPNSISKATDSPSITSSGTISGPNESTSILAQQSSSGSQYSMPNQHEFWDSDFDADPQDPPDWRPKMNQDELARLKPKEKKRQDVINGNFIWNIIPGFFNHIVKITFLIPIETFYL